jgi:hypothetical protein
MNHEICCLQPSCSRDALRYEASRASFASASDKAVEQGERQIERGVRMVLDKGNRKVGILGISFKAGTDDSTTVT